MPGRNAMANGRNQCSSSKCALVFRPRDGESESGSLLVRWTTNSLRKSLKQCVNASGSIQSSPAQRFDSIQNVLHRRHTSDVQTCLNYWPGAFGLTTCRVDIACARAGIPAVPLLSGGRTGIRALRGNRQALPLPWWRHRFVVWWRYCPLGEEECPSGHWIHAMQDLFFWTWILEILVCSNGLSGEAQKLKGREDEKR